MLEFNPLHYKKKPSAKISFDLFLLCNFITDFFCFGGALRKELLYERRRTDFKIFVPIF